ncbi:hypothetical protein LWC05_16780 [Acetobacter sicerae]|uniref:Uncharacterized protein n=1 Tax=Acetobacter sicerae TaxID=85325 RepID=A0ABS8VZA5_9PROT|nr:hypothetical protein [Acetobacter sicerae]MCE0745526.1 hypothetical protein [Acetobacter sicerae]
MSGSVTGLDISKMTDVGTELPTAGGVPFVDSETGEWKKSAIAVLAAGREPVDVISAGGANQVLAFPPFGRACYDITLTADLTIGFSGGTAGEVSGLRIILRQPASGAGFAVHWPDALWWPDATAPSILTTAGGVAQIWVETPDEAATLLGRY